MVRRHFLLEWILVLCGAGSSGVAASQLEATEAFVLRLDQFEYTMAPGVLAFANSGSVTLLAPNQLEQCRRSDVAAQPVSSHRLVYDSLGRFLYLSDPIIRIDGRIAQLRSTSGDLICAGAQAVDRLFSGSFE